MQISLQKKIFIFLEHYIKSQSQTSLHFLDVLLHVAGQQKIVKNVEWKEKCHLAFRLSFRRQYPNLYDIRNSLMAALNLCSPATHAASATTEWFRSKHIPVLERPSKSTDLNVVQNLWQHMKGDVYTYSLWIQDKFQIFFLQSSLPNSLLLHV